MVHLKLHRNSDRLLLLTVTFFADRQLLTLRAFAEIQKLDPGAPADRTGAPGPRGGSVKCFAALILGHVYSHFRL